MNETDAKVTSQKSQRTYKQRSFSSVKLEAARVIGITDPMKVATWLKSYRSRLRAYSGNTNGNRYPDVTSKAQHNALMHVAKGKSHVTDADRKVIRAWAGSK